MDQAVTPFRAFLNTVPGLSPGEVQQRGRGLLPQRVRESALRWWSSAEPKPTDRRFLLLGVAVWSGYDLNLLDQLDRAVAAGARPDVPVYVFDTDTEPSEAALNAIIPEIGFVHHTPVVGYWDGGELVEKGCGYDGRKLVALLFGLDFAALNERVTAAS